ncbi:MAG: hypothetical protein ABIU63_00850 [Chitinophagaceae bacterium]
MNFKQPFEQLIAGKLRQLRAPDADASWQQMKRLLDDDEDTSPGAPKRPPGNAAWWRIGIAAIVLSAGCWLYMQKSATLQQLSNNDPVLPAETSSKSGEANNSTKNKTATIDNNATLNKANNNTAAINTPANTTAEGDHNTENSLGKATAKNKRSNSNNINGRLSPTVRLQAASTRKTSISTVDNKPGNVKKQIAKNNGAGINETNRSEIVLSRAVNRNKSFGINYPNAAITASHSGGRKQIEDVAGSAKEAGYTPNARRQFFSADSKINADLAGDDYRNAGHSRNGTTDIWLDKSPIPYAAPSVVALSINTSLAIGDSITTGTDFSDLLSVETKKAVVKSQRDKAVELLDKKDKKSFHLNLSNVFKPFSLHLDAEPWWAAGLSVNGSVTLNAQSRYNYNVNGKSGTLTDYIPSPYLQYHLNNYVYLQTELNFITPQYTPQLLVYRQSSDIVATGIPNSSGTSQQKSIYIQKLYYFNWPVSLHYSPVSNLYFSAGIQFSSFQSGLAAIEEKQYATAFGPEHATNTNTRILKFKDDSIAAKIAPNEWRWQTGAEYYWNRFSVGLRYNQSFKKAINAVVSPGLPTGIYRNESMLFFVRYNLFESRSKNAVQKNQ